MPSKVHSGMSRIHEVSSVEILSGKCLHGGDKIALSNVKNAIQRLEDEDSNTESSSDDDQDVDSQDIIDTIGDIMVSDSLTFVA